MGVILAVAFGLFVLFMLVVGWRIREKADPVGAKGWLFWLTILLFAFLIMRICGTRHINPDEYFDF